MAGANHFALLESNDPGNTRLADLDNKNQQQPAANITQELFGKAYPSAWKVIRKREKQQNGAAGPANARDSATGGARTDKKKGAGRQGGARKQGGGNGAAANDEAPAPRLYDLAQFPSLK